MTPMGSDYDYDIRIRSLLPDATTCVQRPNAQGETPPRSEMDIWT
jgi:hypothetical protein